MSCNKSLCLFLSKLYFLCFPAEAVPSSPRWSELSRVPSTCRAAAASWFKSVTATIFSFDERRASWESSPLLGEGGGGGFGYKKHLNQTTENIREHSSQRVVVNYKQSEKKLRHWRFASFLRTEKLFACETCLCSYQVETRVDSCWSPFDVDPILQVLRSTSRHQPPHPPLQRPSSWRDHRKRHDGFHNKSSVGGLCVFECLCACAYVSERIIEKMRQKKIMWMIQMIRGKTSWNV